MRELLSHAAAKQPLLSAREFESLLIKPVQRVLRYPLLLEHLCRLMPDTGSSDGPLRSHLQRTVSFDASLFKKTSFSENLYK